MRMDSLRARWRLFVWNVSDWFEDAVDLLRQRVCDHGAWRPALTSKGASRYCNNCGYTEKISVEMFYAYFGRMPF